MTTPHAPLQKIENWAYPFKAKNGQDVTNPQVYQRALADSHGGTYLLGSNGLWHGGVHFDEGTAAHLDQSRVHCIADGEVVAYRVDDEVHRVAPAAGLLMPGKTYSTSVVLVRHRLEAPQIAGHDATPPSLVLFSLYMHLLDWASYEADTALPRPAFWSGDRYRVQTHSGKLNVRSAPNPNGHIQAELSNGTRVRLSGEGDWCRLEEIIDGQPLPLSTTTTTTQPSLGYVARRYLVPEASPKTCNDVVVLDQPFPIKAGAAIGHPGLYLGQRQIHLETFSCDDVPAFIARSRAWAAGLPESEKTLLKVHAGASKLITHRPDIDATHPPRPHDPGIQVGVDFILTQSQLDALPAMDRIIVPANDEGRIRTPELRWWHLKGLLADAAGEPIDGWLCEQDFITSRHSPWEWNSYKWAEDVTSHSAKLAYHWDTKDQLTHDEREKYKVHIGKIKEGTLYKMISQIIDKDKNGKITSKEISISQKNPWQAQMLSKLFTLCGSEWHWNCESWDRLDELMCHSEFEVNDAWIEEKERIKTLSFWSEVESRLSLQSNKAWHLPAILMIQEFISNDEQNSLKWLTVSKGQLTFDAEGTDNSDSIYFSRKAHWPPVGDSGVTIGRGYDLGQQPDVERDLKGAGIAGEYSSWLISAIGKRREHARNHITNAPIEIKKHTITRKQQNILFNRTYDMIEDDVRRICVKIDTLERYAPMLANDPRQAWQNIDEKIKELMVDLRYRGDYTAKTREAIQSFCYINDFSALKSRMQDIYFWITEIGVPEDRFKRRRKHVERW